MMTGLDLIRKLEESGTGKRKLEVAAAFVRANPGATGEDVYEGMRQYAMENRDLGYQGTLEKAASILRTGKWVPPAPSAQTVSDKLAAELAGEKEVPRPPATFDMPSLEERDSVDELERLRKENAELKAANTAEPTIGPKTAKK